MFQLTKKEKIIHNSLTATKKTIGLFRLFLDECITQDYYTVEAIHCMEALDLYVMPLLRKNVSIRMIKLCLKGLNKQLMTLQNNPSKGFFNRVKYHFRDLFYCVFLRYSALHGEYGYFDMYRKICGGNLCS